MPRGLAKTWTIERLRLAVVVVAAVLLLAIFGFILYGRWRLRHVAQDIPARLGIQIQQTTQGLVLSQSNNEGRTIFTLHAARAVEFKSGKRISLHDVKIDLYNQPDGKADTIAGQDFEYDPDDHVVQSQGETHIVLYTPQKDANVAGKNAGQLIHITTHGMVFNQKTGVATCSGEVDFQVGNSNGQALGARYDSKQGHLLLQSKVVLTTTMHNRPALLRASQAVYDRNAGQIHLRQPRYSAVQQHGTESGQAEAAVVYLRTDGSAERLDAKGTVQLNSGDRTSVRADLLNATLNENSQPKQMHFSGDVKFSQNQPAQQTTGGSQEAVIDFDDQGRAEHAIFDRQVQFHQQMDENSGRLLRTLTSNHLVLHLLPTKTGQAQLQSADATGDAAFTSQSAGTGHAPQKTSISGQTLTAKFLPENHLQTMTGTGQTRIRTVAANGDIDTSSGDTLKIDFNPGTGLAKRAAPTIAASGSTGQATQSIHTAVQTGHVVLEQIGKAKNGGSQAPQISTTTATRAKYVAANDTLTLTGSPVFRNQQLEMTADRIEAEHASGTVVFIGAVQATLRPGDPSRNSPSGSLLGGNQPVHVIARQATLLHDKQEAIFAGRARLWQGGDSVEAPVIEMSQKRQTLTAYSNPPCMQCIVSNFLGHAAGRGTSSTPKLSESPRPSSFHIVSGRLLYSDAERKVTFYDHVQVTSSGALLIADHAEIFLTAAAHPVGAGHFSAHQAGQENNFSLHHNNSGQSSVERIVATGNVQLQQPGRRGTGTRLVYTANDGKFVLTGDGANPPEVFDVDRGTVTGQVLTFFSPEQAIIVSGNANQATTTRTRVHKK